MTHPAAPQLHRHVLSHRWNLLLPPLARCADPAVPTRPEPRHSAVKDPTEQGERVGWGAAHPRQHRGADLGLGGYENQFSSAQTDLSLSQPQDPEQLV